MLLGAGREGRRRGARGRQTLGARGVRPGRWALGLGAGRSAWAPGLALGCALGALDLFLALIDSVFSLVKNF